jgi:hypothetical protein
MSKIELNFTSVSRGTQKQWEFIWSIEQMLGIKYDGEDDFEEISQWIDDYSDEYYHKLSISGGY